MKRLLLPVLAGIIMSSCSGHFLSDRSYRDKVFTDFGTRSWLLDSAGIDLQSMGLSTREMEAMTFLYAYMPVGDVLNEDAEYWLGNCRLTEAAVASMPWGRKVPERELRHFVLPVRVNNENLDTSRAVFFRELYPRVKDLSMYDAVLEVNHWCHEKAVYRPTDSRTCSPLSIVRTAYGRCGEESTFLVAALRSVGIPARQVYTPRWAHTDDNHAWVEAWVDGKWHFLGACEPEPVLDLGWFNAPASRGMLMHTKVFGHYDGPEEVVKVTPGFTEINVIDNYAPDAAGIAVKVVDTDGKAVPGARVEFRLYNYAEFYPVAVKEADASGCARLTAGLGDMLVFVSDGDRFGMRKVTFGKDTEVAVPLEYTPGCGPGHISMEVVPPVGRPNVPDVPDSLREKNSFRMSCEDSIRNEYVGTFFTPETAGAYAMEAGLDVARTAPLLVTSRGNHPEICAFLAGAKLAGRQDDALSLLESLPEKDLMDTPSAVLADHLMNTEPGADARSVLCPRVSVEMLTEYREFFLRNIPDTLASPFRNDPSELVAWCRENLILADSLSMPYVNVAPVRVWESRVADSDSRDVFFVAVCRTLGVPAWKDVVTGTVRYSNGGKVYDVDFGAERQGISPKGTVRLEYEAIPLLPNPEYYSNFTVSRWSDGSFELMEYPGNTAWDPDFSRGMEMDCGDYMLVGGTRMSGGNVLADVEFFTVSEGKCTDVSLKLRDDASQIRVIGSFDSEAVFDRIPAGEWSEPSEAMDEAVPSSVLSVTGRGYFAVILADSGHEPTNHVMNDISRVASGLESWGRPILVIFASDEDCRKFRASEFSLPSTVVYGIDPDGTVRKKIAAGMKTDGAGSLPLVLVADTFNRVVFFSEGYTIGLGAGMLKTVKAL